MGIAEKPKQLRRFTIISETISRLDGTLCNDGKLERHAVLHMLSDVVDSMYIDAGTVC